MTRSNTLLYLYTFLSSLGVSLALVPAARALAVRLNVFDRPNTDVKTHKQPVP